MCSNKNPKKDETQEKIYLTFLTLGSSTVDKSSFITRYAKKFFPEKIYATIGIDFQNTNLTLFDKKILLKLYDTAGQEKFRSISRQYYKNADGILLMFNIADRQSFKDIEKWMKEIKDNIDVKSIVLLLIGNKCNLEEERKISKEEAIEMAEQNDMSYFETSARTGQNVNESIEHLVTKCLNNKQLITSMIIRQYREKSDKSILLEEKKLAKIKEKAKCC